MIVASWSIKKVVGDERYSDKNECYHQVVTSTKVLVRGNFNGHVGCDMGISVKFTGDLEIDNLMMEWSDGWAPQLAKGCVLLRFVSIKEKLDLQHS